ncbi:MAG: hypothetical protein WCI79_03340 [Candidatus Saccharibacteria bacterium]
MSLLNYLQPQKIDDSADDFYDGRMADDSIALDEQIDEASLENFWDKVVADIHADPEWFTFDNK